MGIHKGQKLTTDPRKNSVCVRLTDSQLEELDKSAEILHETRSKTIVRAIEKQNTELKTKK